VEPGVSAVVPESATVKAEGKIILQGHVPGTEWTTDMLIGLPFGWVAAPKDSGAAVVNIRVTIIETSEPTILAKAFSDALTANKQALKQAASDLVVPPKVPASDFQGASTQLTEYTDAIGAAVISLAAVCTELQKTGNNRSPAAIRTAIATYEAKYLIVTAKRISMAAAYAKIGKSPPSLEATLPDPVDIDANNPATACDL
jgi:hypothetical protein